VGSRRAPLFVAIGVGVLALLLIVFLVLPKMREVSDAQDTLTQSQQEEDILTSQRAALQEAKDNAPEARAAIKDVHLRIPPVADEAGLYRLLKNAGTTAGLDVVTISVSNPTFDPETLLTSIPATISASGTYFEIAEFMYEIETLPRAAKATTFSLSPGQASGSIPELTLTTSVVLYTSDASAGPSSEPGPTEAP
jgi:Tfp pilus assembly protein PilO